ncbi:hypothetical protein M1N79_05160, partial [Dehalococcoidia bacterium]|nr:hypothetical protein [Dehalococcoidia bacterium]
KCRNLRARSLTFPLACAIILTDEDRDVQSSEQLPFLLLLLLVYQPSPWAWEDMTKEPYK